MGFLNPLFLVAGLAVAVPLILHLVHRHDSRRLAFPALRYLQRTERQHARQIRLRQLLLLLLRVATVLLIVGAGARLFLRGRGNVHDPTAVVIVLDNSMSSGLVDGGRRVLDELKALAMTTLDAATAEDRIWIIRVGDADDLVVPGTPQSARVLIDETTVSHAGGNLDVAIGRAIAIAADAELDSREVHVLSDLQASAFRERVVEEQPTNVPVVMFRPEVNPPDNRHLTDVLVGGGLPPVAGQRTEVAASVGEGAGDTVWVRLIVDQRVRAAGTTPPGATVLLPGGPFAQGALSGYVETDPDSLAADDRRYFAVSVRPAPGLALEGEEAFFLDQALGTLEMGGRVRRVPLAQADMMVAVTGVGLERRPDGVPALVVPSSDPALLPALNRRLAAAGIPWRYGALSTGGEAPLVNEGLEVDLVGVRVSSHFELAATEPAIDQVDVLARLPAGEPWLIIGQAESGPYLLIASPLDEASSSLPLSAAMLPLVEWIVTRSAARGGGSMDVEAGMPFQTAASATSVRTPDGTVFPIDGTRLFRTTRLSGIYQVLDRDSVVDQVAVNVPVRESNLERVGVNVLRARYGEDLTMARDSAAWTRAVFTQRQGLEVWKGLLVLVVLLLAAESWVAAAGPARGGPSGTVAGGEA